MRIVKKDTKISLTTFYQEGKSIISELMAPSNKLRFIINKKAKVQNELKKNIYYFAPNRK